MNNFFSLKPIALNIFSRSVRKLKKSGLKCYTTKPAVQSLDDKTNEMMKDYEKLANISLKVKKKKPQKPPFVKNLFLGIYDTDVLAYPELEKDEQQNLDKQLQPIQSYLENVTPQQKPLNLASDFSENLRRLRLFGLRTPQLLDGRELSVMEACRFDDELSVYTSAAPGLLCNEHLGIQALLKMGTDDHKKKYLPGLISGQMLSAFCISENTQADLTKLQTTAMLSSDKKTWILNGEKAWIVNGSNANLFVVLASTETLNRLGLKEAGLTAFLVEKDFQGITTAPCDSLGIEGTDVSNVQFKNTPVPVDNILGEANKGDSIILSLITEARLSTGPACAGILRKLINNLVNHCKVTNSADVSITEVDYVQMVIAEITTSLYAIESVAYLTAGLLDDYENQDCQAEAAIVKVFGAEQASASTLKGMGLIGTAAYMKDHWANVLHRDALSQVFINETVNNLKLHIALLGLQHAGVNIQETIRKIRNPLFYPADVLKRLWTQRRQAADNPKRSFYLEHYVHPTANTAANILEYCVLRLQFATETVLARYGPEVINKHMELQRLAECIIDIYVMTACLARASRSYCIGLQHGDYEMLIATTYCLDAMQRVKKRVNDIYDGPFATNDENYRKVAKRVFKFGKYFPVHPLSRNF